MGVGRIKGFERRPWWHLACRYFWKGDSGKDCSEVHQAVQADKETLPAGRKGIEFGVEGGSWRILGPVFQEGVGRRRMTLSMHPYTPG